MSVHNAIWMSEQFSECNMTSSRGSFKPNSFEINECPNRPLNKIKNDFHKISLLFHTVLESVAKAFYQLFSWSSVGPSKCPIDKMISLQGYLTVWTVFSVPRVVATNSFMDTFFEMKKFPKKELINFCKSYDNEETFQLLLQPDHLINSTVWYLVFGLNFLTSILVMITYYKGI